jgi:DNA-binding response OmpR family regulator
MSRKAFCPFCVSVQPLVEHYEEDEPWLWCATCGSPVERAPGDGRERPRPPTILCIDDDRLVLSVCSDALERHGFRSLIALDGLTGIEMARRERPDLIFLDVMMPGMTGLEVCQRLRAEPGLQATPIILLTALTNPNLSVKGREAGATTTMRKPSDPATIIHTVERILARKAHPMAP